MAILKTMPDKNAPGDRNLNRVFPVTVKLTREELGRVTDFARSQGLARGEWIRDVILREAGGRTNERSSAGGDSWGSLALGKRVATCGRWPTPHPRSIRQTPG